MKRLKFLAIFIFIMFTTVSLARPGGGGSSGSGGSSSSRSRCGSSNYTQQSNPNSGGVAMLAMSTTIIIMSKTNYIISWFKVTKKKKQCRRVLMDLSKYNFNWELDKINKDIKDTFYIMSKAWTNMDQDIAIEYSTKKLYENHKTKLEWMKIRNERNILKMEKLISAKVIGIETNNYENVDIIWVYIIGSMIDYIERDGRIVGGNKFISKPYVEYWKFKQKNGRWILDEIKQQGNPSELDEIIIKI